MRKFSFYFISFFIWLIVTFFLVEIIFRIFVFTPDSDYQKIYEAIINPKTVIPYSSQPFLNYINTPNLKDSEGNFEVNSMGIRYPREIELRKPDSTLRILFLGGSTTFGEIEDTFENFPALIEKKLRAEFLPFQKRFNDVECLNAGAHGLTSAEILNHFQFKYQYLQPDLIVIHTGVNDAFAYAKIHGSIYQPDYHNSRRVFYDVKLPSSFERKLLYSKAYAYLLIHSRLKDFMRNNLEDNIFYYHWNDKLWFKPGNDAITDTTYNAFYNNIKTLVSVANLRGASVLIIPEVVDSTEMPPPLNHILPEGLRLNRQMLRTLAAIEKSFVLDTLPDAEFTPDFYNGTDGIHASRKGEQLKAHYMTHYIIPLLDSIVKKHQR